MVMESRRIYIVHCYDVQIWISSLYLLQLCTIVDCTALIIIMVFVSSEDLWLLPSYRVAGSHLLLGSLKQWGKWVTNIFDNKSILINDILTSQPMLQRETPSEVCDLSRVLLLFQVSKDITTYYLHPWLLVTVPSVLWQTLRVQLILIKFVRDLWYGYNLI